MISGQLAMISGQPATWFLMVLIALIVGFIWMLFCRRTRVLALGLLGIAALGLLFLRVNQRSNWVVPGEETVVHSGMNVMDPHLLEVQRHAEQVRQDQSEILRNQRLAARMDDAFVQESPDGSTLETYPDGMQIRQRLSDGFRMIVRPASGDPLWTESYSLKSSRAFFILGAPFLLLLVAFLSLKFLSLKALRTDRRWPAMGWVAITAISLIFGGFFVAGTERRMADVVEPMPQRFTDDGLLSGSEAAVAEVPLGAPATGLAEMTAAAKSQESIESLWARLTAPKIDLGPAVNIESTATRRELANAAKIILATSAPGADPFTQGWLINAAKAILNEAKTSHAINSSAVELEIAAAASPDPFAAPIAQYVAQHEAVVEGKKAGKAAAALAIKQTPGKTRPDWIDNPPKLAGDTRRIVVSTDPLKTSEECRVHLEKRLRFAVADRVRELAKQATGRSTVNSPMLAEMGISPDYILRELCPEGAYFETVNGSAGKMKQAHALVEYTPQKDGILLQRWQSATQTPIVRPVTAASPSPAIPYSTGERPDWLDQPPTLVGNTQRVVVSTDPFLTIEECQVALREKLRGVVQARVDDLARAANGGHYVSTPSIDSLGVSIEYVLAEVCPDPDKAYIETINTSVGEMKRAHALVEFNDGQDRFLLDRWRAYARIQSIEVVAVLSAFVMGGLAFVYALLKVDTWTRGYYTKRLFIGVPAAIIAVTVGFIALVETFH